MAPVPCLGLRGRDPRVPQAGLMPSPGGLRLLAAPGAFTAVFCQGAACPAWAGGWLGPTLRQPQCQRGDPPRPAILEGAAGTGPSGRKREVTVAPLLRTAGTESLLSGARRPDGSRAQLMVRLLEVTVIVLCASTTVHGPYRRIVPCASSSVKQDGVPPSQHPRCIHTAGCISASDHARDRDARV